MNDSTSNERARVIGLLSILNEYARLLREMADQGQRLIEEKAEMRKIGMKFPEQKHYASVALYQRTHAVTSKVNDVARRASALIEHSITDEFVKMEMELVLANVETTARYATEVVNAGLSQ